MFFIFFLVHDFPRPRLELSVWVSLRTGRRHEVPREETEGRLSEVSGLSHYEVFKLLPKSKRRHLWLFSRCRSQRISTRSCRTFVNTSTPASPTSPASWCLTPDSKSPPTRSLTEGLKVNFLCLSKDLERQSGLKWDTRFYLTGCCHDSNVCHFDSGWNILTPFGWTTRADTGRTFELGTFLLLATVHYHCLNRDGWFNVLTQWRRT